MKAATEHLSPLRRWSKPQRAAFACVAVVIAAGGMLAASAAVHAGGIAGPRVVLNLISYVCLCGLVYRWGMEVYGVSGAIAASALVAFLPQLLGQVGSATAELIGAAWFLGAAYALVRCVLDPTMQRALLAGVAIGGGLLSTYTAIALLPFSLLVVVGRIVSAERWEPRSRVAHGAIVSVLIAWAVAVLILNAGIRVGQSYPATRDALSRNGIVQPSATGALAVLVTATYVDGLSRAMIADPQAAGARGVGKSDASSVRARQVWVGWRRTPLLLLLLVCARRWRWERRYSDSALLAAGVCLVFPLGLFPRATIAHDWLLPAVPFLGLLAAATWDRDRGRRVRRLATFAVVVQILTALLLWPGYACGLDVPVAAAARWEGPQVRAAGGKGDQILPQEATVSAWAARAFFASDGSLSYTNQLQGEPRPRRRCALVGFGQ